MRVRCRQSQASDDSIEVDQLDVFFETKIYEMNSERILFDCAGDLDTQFVLWADEQVKKFLDAFWSCSIAWNIDVSESTLDRHWWLFAEFRSQLEHWARLNLHHWAIVNTQNLNETGFQGFCDETSLERWDRFAGRWHRNNSSLVNWDTFVWQLEIFLIVQVEVGETFCEVFRLILAHFIIFTLLDEDILRIHKVQENCVESNICGLIRFRLARDSYRCFEAMKSLKVWLSVYKHRFFDILPARKLTWLHSSSREFEDDESESESIAFDDMNILTPTWFIVME